MSNISPMSSCPQTSKVILSKKTRMNKPSRNSRWIRTLNLCVRSQVYSEGSHSQNKQPRIRHRTAILNGITFNSLCLRRHGCLNKCSKTRIFARKEARICVINLSESSLQKFLLLPHQLKALRDVLQSHTKKKRPCTPSCLIRRTFCPTQNLLQREKNRVSCNLAIFGKGTELVLPQLKRPPQQWKEIALQRKQRRLKSQPSYRGNKRSLRKCRVTLTASHCRAFLSRI